MDDQERAFELELEALFPGLRPGEQLIEWYLLHNTGE